MRRDDRSERTGSAPARDQGVVVFDFTGLGQTTAMDLALILTARLQAAPGSEVWVRSLPWQTATILRAMRLDHLFRAYPETPEIMN